MRSWTSAIGGGDRAATGGNDQQASDAYRVSKTFLKSQRKGSEMSRMTIAALGLFALAAAFCAPPASAQTILFEGARVIPGDGSAAIEGGVMLIERGLITRVGKKGEIAAPAGADRVDLAGKTVMPAILSTHVHPGFQRGLSYSAANYTRDNILDDLNRSLYFGISTVMSLGVEKGDVMFEMRADQAAGKLGGAKL